MSEYEGKHSSVIGHEIIGTLNRMSEYSYELANLKNHLETLQEDFMKAKQEEYDEALGFSIPKGMNAIDASPPQTEPKFKLALDMQNVMSDDLVQELQEAEFQQQMHLQGVRPDQIINPHYHVRVIPNKKVIEEYSGKIQPLRAKGEPRPCIGIIERQLKEIEVSNNREAKSINISLNVWYQLQDELGDIYPDKQFSTVEDLNNLGVYPVPVYVYNVLDGFPSDGGQLIHDFIQVIYWTNKTKEEK
jgi:hypothetical protein